MQNAPSRSAAQLMTVREGDKIGLFMVGWSDVKSCKLFVSFTNNSSGRQIKKILLLYHLMVSLMEVYQFKYNRHIFKMNWNFI
jgi:hypothetical protein